MTPEISSIATFISSSDVARRDGVNLWRECGHAIPDVLTEFYAALRATGEFDDLLGSNEKIARLKAAQSEHWKLLFQPVLPAGFEDRARKIGQAHVKISLSSGWYMAGYAFLLKKILPRMAKRLRFSPGAFAAAVDILIERVFTDMVLSNSAYEIGVAAARALASVEENKLNGLASAAHMVADTNSTAIDLVHLTRNTTIVNQNSQSISAAASQLVASVEEIARNAEGAAGEASQSDEAVAFGRAAMRDVSSAIANISSAVEQTSASVDDLSAASAEIGDVLAVIEGIARQTNCSPSMRRSRPRARERPGAPSPSWPPRSRPWPPRRRNRPRTFPAASAPCEREWTTFSRPWGIRPAPSPRGEWPSTGPATRWTRSPSASPMS
jgi:methyl-accepting chemotaxis protein